MVPDLSPKEMATQLMYDFYHRIEHTLSEEYSKHEWDVVKECALIALKRIMDPLNDIVNRYDHTDFFELYEYYNQVKQEIIKS